MIEKHHRSAWTRAQISRASGEQSYIIASSIAAIHLTILKPNSFSQQPQRRATNAAHLAIPDEALLVVPHEPTPPGHPSEGALDDPAAWKDFEALRGIGPSDDFDGEVEERGLVHELGAVVGAIGESQGQRLRTLSRIICAPALSETV
jgi:hypothetical protein